MNRFICFFVSLFVFSTAGIAQNDTLHVSIQTNVGTMKGILFPDVPRHIQTFVSRAQKGLYNGTLFTRVIKDFMIQGGAPDSRNASPGVRCGFGEKSAEILPENSKNHFSIKGALAAPRQQENNPEQKSDMSQFFIVQGKVYTKGQLDTLEQIQNKEIRKKALIKYYIPKRMNLMQLKKENKTLYMMRLRKILKAVHDEIAATPGHLYFTPEQRKAYTTIGGCQHLDGKYTIFGQITEGLDLIDKIANQPKDKYNRPLKDIRIIKVSIF